jgi:endonuclease-3 related protein
MMEGTWRMAFTFSELYQRLLTQYGRQQGWWPADTPFEVMLGAILTQNTNWSNVQKALANLKLKIDLDPQVILNLSVEELESCLKPSGYFRIKTQRVQSYCRWYLLQGGYEGLQQFSTQKLRNLLLQLHGIGPETADGILLYAFERPVFIIDAYTRRLLKHLQMIKGNESYEILRNLFEKNLPKRVELYKQFHALIVEHAKRCGAEGGAGVKKNRAECEICQLTK